MKVHLLTIICLFAQYISLAYAVDAIFLCLAPYVTCSGDVPDEGVFQTIRTNVSGFSVDFWQEVSNIANLDPVNFYMTNNLIEYIDFLQNNLVMGISGIPQNAYSAQLPTSRDYYTTPIRAGFLPKGTADTTQAIVLVFSRPDVWTQMLFWIMCAILIAHLLWAIEKIITKKHSKDFRRQYPIGIWDGFYWAGVTTSTVGYGDKTPKSGSGKCVTLIWMLFSFFFSLTVSATVTSLVTIVQLQPPPLALEDFRAVNVAVLKHSPLIPQILGVNGIVHEYNTLLHAYYATVNGTASFLVSDQASMASLNTTTTRIKLTGPSFGDLSYVFSLSPGLGSEVLDGINTAILLFQYQHPATYRTYIEYYFNHTHSDALGVSTREEQLAPYVLLIAWASVILFLLSFMIVADRFQSATKHNHYKKEKNEEAKKQGDDKD